MAVMESDNLPPRRWDAGYSRVPFWLYSDPEIYTREMETIFCGRSWAYVALEAEIPNPGDFKRSWVGDRPVIVTRDADGGVNVVVNRCAHRGVQFCRQPLGNAKEFTCPYHQWTYDLKGNLLGVPFRRGVKRQGGMPDEFDRENHGLTKLKVHTRGGVVFASFRDDVEPFEGYMGEAMLGYFDRVFDGRPLKVLGYSRQLIPSNWKLMFENIKDPYHASLLHVFLVTFGLFRADTPSAVKMDPTGRHAVLLAMKGEQKHSDATADMRNLREDFTLNDARLLDPVREYQGETTVCMQTLWPNIIIQQQSNSLAMRQINPRGPGKFELAWTFIGYADEDEAMTTRRLRQANLFGPSGLVSVDDSEIMKLSQDGIGAYENVEGVYEMGGHDTGDESHMVTEAAIRAFYKAYRDVMGL